MPRRPRSRRPSTSRYVVPGPADPAQQVGHALLHLDAYDEDYLITLPPLHIEGLITGSPYVELNSSTYIQSSSGYTARIDYSGKGWVSGKKNTFTAVLYPDGREKDAIYKADGQWTDTFQIRDAKTKAVVDKFDHKLTKTTPLIVAPIEQQDAFETRRAWKKVADAIVKGDLDTTSAEKTIIETRQRRTPVASGSASSSPAPMTYRPSSAWRTRWARPSTTLRLTACGSLTTRRRVVRQRRSTRTSIRRFTRGSEVVGFANPAFLFTTHEHGNGTNVTAARRGVWGTQ
jgi:hypothetical protein